MTDETGQAIIEGLKEIREVLVELRDEYLRVHPKPQGSPNVGYQMAMERKAEKDKPKK